MKTCQRVLLPYTPGRSGAALLRRAGEIAASRQAELLVVSVLDTRSGFDADGPAANLPGERAARRAPAEQKRLELQLKQSKLGRAQASVIWGEPRAALSALIRNWRPDLVVCDDRTSRMLSARTGHQEGPEMLTVSRDGHFARLTRFFFPHAQGQA